MDVTDLERAVRETEVKGHIPLAVVGTAGTTVMGAFDPLDQIADICAQHSMWLHVDVSMCVCVVMTCEGPLPCTAGFLWRLCSDVSQAQAPLPGNRSVGVGPRVGVGPMVGVVYCQP